MSEHKITCYLDEAHGEAGVDCSERPQGPDAPIWWFPVRLDGETTVCPECGANVRIFVRLETEP